MSFQDHLKTCSYCRKDSQKVTVSIKSASGYYKEKKLAELGAVIRGVSYPSVSYVGVKKANVTKTNVKGASSRQERQFKLRELGKLIRG